MRGVRLVFLDGDYRGLADTCAREYSRVRLAMDASRDDGGNGGRARR